ncbi:hypothetical protein [Coraliomargarita akajimensis]|uniref:Uncharacterized protein n=1 Tax=Coraliomargarita akajimensis (strain DSM 45221 / IAM 15411 / JCM 23193 / KCTC 12865 / 04OKA010-24) TaxID=583355 RepID=D5EME5_CORAD|nr:hypothetical protein [Coraliomargarita akajimensis]ADE53351.1 hypothetical protein Caka_0326 [Coraliomargarita akajimensis DSM 45221]
MKAHLQKFIFTTLIFGILWPIQDYLNLFSSDRYKRNNAQENLMDPNASGFLDQLLIGLAIGAAISAVMIIASEVKKRKT